MWEDAASAAGSVVASAAIRRRTRDPAGAAQLTAFRFTVSSVRDDRLPGPCEMPWANRRVVGDQPSSASASDKAAVGQATTAAAPARAMPSSTSRENPAPTWTL